LLNEEVLCQPFLHIFNTVYKDDASFPDYLKPGTPVADQVSNMSKIRQIRHHPPTDNNVVDFLTNSFPDLYLASGDFGPQGVDWGTTLSGQGEADMEKIMINVWLVQLWLYAVSALDIQHVLWIEYLLQAFTPVAVSPSRLWFMFLAVFLHELTHCTKTGNR
jgi:hypothetical protein